MANHIEHIRQLCQLYVANNASDEELKELLTFLKEPSNDSVSKELFFQMIYSVKGSVGDKEQLDDLEVAWEDMLETSQSLRVQWQKQQEVSHSIISSGKDSEISVRPAHRVHFLRKWGWAAAAILLLGSGAYFYNASKKTQQTLAKGDNSLQTDILPGSNRAILTVGNKSINLSNNKTGITVGNVITYNDGEKITDAGQLLQLTTPRGGQYQAVLPDGSKIWLNAASSIKFPSKFTGDKREVEITGEAYIEVVKNARQPFFVYTNKTGIQVLGTSFNVNAYSDEETVKTTLIEGSVRVTSEISHTARNDGRETRNDDAGVILKPGQQAITYPANQNPENLKNIRKIVIQTINTNEATAWKSGFFKFEETPIENVMRQLARWYDLEVSYEGKLDAHFIATISRDVPLSQIIRILESTKAVHFKIEGNKIIVSP